MAKAIRVRVGVIWWESPVRDLHLQFNNTLPAPNLWNVAAVNVVLGGNWRFSVLLHHLLPPPVNIASYLWS